MNRFYLHITMPSLNSKLGVMDAGRHEDKHGQILKRKPLSFSQYLLSKSKQGDLSNLSFKFLIMAHISFIIGFLITLQGYRFVLENVILAVDPWDIIISVIGMILYGIVILFYFGIEVYLLLLMIRRWRSRSG